MRKGAFAGKNVNVALPVGCANGIPFSIDLSRNAIQTIIPVAITKQVFCMLGAWMLIPAPRIEKNIHGNTGYVPE